MKPIRFAIIAAAALVACVHARPIRTPSGGHGFSISCDAEAACYKAASEACRSEYEILQTGKGFSMMSWTSVEHTLIVECGTRKVDAPATAGCAKDTDCKGDRVCDRGRCVSPDPVLAPVAQPVR